MTHSRYHTANNPGRNASVYVFNKVNWKNTQNDIKNDNKIISILSTREQWRVCRQWDVRVGLYCIRRKQKIRNLSLCGIKEVGFVLLVLEGSTPSGGGRVPRDSSSIPGLIKIPTLLHQSLICTRLALILRQNTKQPQSLYWFSLNGSFITRRFSGKPLRGW